MNAFRRFSLLLGAAALLVPALGFAAPAQAQTPAPVAAAVPIDEFGCVMQLMFYVTEGRKMLADTTQPAEKRAEMGGLLVEFGLALGYFEGRLSAIGAGDFKARSEAAFTRMQAMNDDQMTNATMACIDVYKAGEARMMDRMLGK